MLTQIVMIQKLGKAAEFTESYMPISLLPILSKTIRKTSIAKTFCNNGKAK